MASGFVPDGQVMSDLLTIREKGILFTLLEPQCKLIKTTVAQVLEAREMQGGGPGWSCLGCGAVCLVEDESIRSYFLRLYCVKRARLLWEQELYIPFKYTAPCKFFHTFPADGHQVGLNFANEDEAEEFHLAVAAVQKNQEKMVTMIETTAAGNEDNSTRDTSDSGTEPFQHSDGEQNLVTEEPSITVTPANSSFKGLDHHMKRLLLQANLTGKDLKDKDITEAVDCIINQFGDLKAVQNELRSRGPVSQTLPRTAGASISLALKKGPLPPVPTIRGNPIPQQTPKGRETKAQSQIPPWVPPPPSTPAPVLPERIRRSASFKHVDPPPAADRGDLVLTALREVFRQKQLLQTTSTDDSETEPDTDTHKF